jgi:integrase
MASFRKLGSGKWQCIVRRKGHSPVTKTFTSKADGDKWARHLEAEIDRGSYVPRSFAENTTIGLLIDRYIAEVSPLKRSQRREVQRLQYLRKYFGNLSPAALRSQHVAQWRDKRLSEGKAGSTVIKEMNSLSHVLDTATRDWNVSLPTNPVKQVRKPKQSRGRDRRITEEELAAIKTTKIGPIVTLAVETGMRLGELLSLEWNLIDHQSRTATLPITKNGDKRIVPLSPSALATLKGIERNGQRVFSQWGRTDSLENAWSRTLVRLRMAHKQAHGPSDFLSNLRFHDLRHEAASRLFERGLNMMEVASITGHKTLAMLKRYTHLDPSKLALKLAA